MIGHFSFELIEKVKIKVGLYVQYNICFHGNQAYSARKK